MATGRRAVAILCGYGFALSVLACETGPTYKGRSVSSWMADLDGTHDFQRRGACEAMGEIGPPAKAAVPRLIELLEDDDGRVQFAAAEALAKVGRDAVAHLEPLLSRSEPDLRFHAAVILLDIDPKHVGAIDQLLQSLVGVGNAELAKLARERAVRLGPSLLPRLLPLLADSYAPVRAQVVETIAGFGEAAQAAILPLVALAKSEKDAGVRREIVSAVGRMGPREVVEPHLRALADDEDGTVVLTANRMLELIGAIERPTQHEAEVGEGTGEAAADEGSQKGLRSLLSDSP